MSTDIVILEDDPSWALGDVLLVSSDHVKLYASSHILAYASPVFQEMLSLPNPHGPNTQERTLRLTDPDFEDAETIRTALSLFTYHRLDFDLNEDVDEKDHDDRHEDDTDEDDEGHDPYDDDYTDSEGEGNAENDWSGDFPSYTEIDIDDSTPAIPWKDRLLKVISFFDKYNSDRGFSLLKSAGVHAYHQKKFRHALDAFVFAALTGDVDLCTTVVGADHSTRWAKPDSKDRGRAQRAGDLLSINSFPYQYLCAMPLQFQFALNRASCADMPGTKSFAKAFAKALKAALAAKGLQYQPVSTDLPTLLREPRP